MGGYFNFSWFDLGLGGGCVVDGGDCGYGKWVADSDGDGCGGGFLLRFVGLTIDFAMSSSR